MFSLKELDRKKQQNLRDRKEEYFQKHLSLETNQRNNRLLKSFRQMSRMRTCLSDLDLSRNLDSDWENPKQDSTSVKVSGLELDLDNPDVKGKDCRLQERPRSWTAVDLGTPKLPSSGYYQVKIIMIMIYAIVFDNCNEKFIVDTQEVIILFSHFHSRSLCILMFLFQ